MNVRNVTNDINDLNERDPAQIHKRRAIWIFLM